MTYMSQHFICKFLNRLSENRSKRWFYKTLRLTVKILFQKKGLVQFGLVEKAETEPKFWLMQATSCDSGYSVYFALLC